MVLQHLWVGVSENGRWWGRLERFVFLVGELVAKSHPSSGTRLYAVRVAFHLQDYFVPRVLQAEVQTADAREQGHRLHGRFRAGAARDGVRQKRKTSLVQEEKRKDDPSEGDDEIFKSRNKTRLQTVPLIVLV